VTFTSRETRIAPSVALVFTALILSGVPLCARQSDRDRSQLRTVQGRVLDKNQNPIADGIVYLRNKKTNNIRTHISDSEGRYQFTGLDPTADFVIHAEYKGRKSARRNISSFDDRRHIEMNLIIPIKR